MGTRVETYIIPHTHTYIYIYKYIIYAYYYTYTTEGMNMQLCWLYLLFLMFTEDWFWPIARWHDVWRLMDVYWPRSKQFCFGRADRNLMCQKGSVCFTLVFYWLEHCAHTILVVVCQRFFWLCEKMRMKNTRKSIHSSPNMSKLKNISSSYCWVELTYNSVTLNSLGNIVVSLLKLLHS